MKDKIVSADEAVAIIRDRDTLCTSGFVGVGTPDELLVALEKRYLQTRHPSDLTILFAAAPDGLIQRVVGGHWALVPRLGELALANRIEAYNLPLGCISHLYRSIAAGGPGTITKIGLRSFVDPRDRKSV